MTRRKETRWHSFTESTQEEDCFPKGQAAVSLRSRSTSSGVGNLWPLGSSGNRRTGGQAGGSGCLPGGGQGWSRGCCGCRAVHGVPDSRLSSGAVSLPSIPQCHSWADRQVSRTGLGVLPVLRPSLAHTWCVSQTQKASPCSAWAPCPLWEPRRSFLLCQRPRSSHYQWT